MKTKENLSGFLSTNNKTPYSSVDKPQIGRVYGVITTENTPTKKQFNKYGGFSAIGTVFYRDYNESINLVGENSDEFFDQCEVARPFNSDTPFPLVDELILIEDLPTASTQLLSIAGRKYYLGVIGIWNNIQHNAQPASDRYGFKTFKPTDDIRNLLPFEGDKIFLGRKGNSIRLTSTIKDKSDINEWSSGPGNDGDPLLIISNGYNLNPNSPYHIEYVNKESSSIYITSTQQIPLIPDRKDILNPLTNPTKPAEYYKPQIILNSDRIVLNSKKDDILLLSTSNVEISTNYVINLNANDRVHLNTSKIFLGTNKDGTLPEEPLILGGQMVEFLSQFLLSLSEFCSKLQSVKSTPEGSDLVQLQTAAKSLNSFLLRSLKSENLIDKLLSKQNFTK